MKPASPGAPIDVSALLGFYLACVEEEDRRSLQISADPKYGQFLIPPGDPGSLFRGSPEIEWTPAADDQRFIEKYSFDTAKQRFLYGYPLFYDKDGYISPLFFAEAELVPGDGKTQAKIHLTHPGTLQVNLHLFRWTHLMLLERMDLQDFLEGPDFGTIDARIAAALAKLETPATDISKAATPKGQPGWKNISIIFRDTGAGFTAQLRRELSDLKNHLPRVPGTGLGALLGAPTTALKGRTSKLEAVPLNASQRLAVDSALTNPLTVITGPPGTGKSQVVVAMLASFGAAGLPVLFASKNNQAVDVVRERLAVILGDADWFMRLGNKPKIDSQLSSRIDEAAKLVSSPPPELGTTPADVDKATLSRDKIETTIQERVSILERYLLAAHQERLNLAELSPSWLKWLLAGPSTDWMTNVLKTSLIRDTPDLQALAGDQWPGLWLWLKRLILGRTLLNRYRSSLLAIAPGCDLPRWESADNLTWASLKSDYSNLDGLRKHLALRHELDAAWRTLSSQTPAADLKQDLQAASTHLQEISSTLARGMVLQRLHKNAARLPTIIKEYWELTQKAARLSQRAYADVQAAFGRSAKRLLNIVPGVVVTSLSARRSIPLEPGLFECAIIDEASQCDIASAMPLLLRAKRLVVIGDPKQLRHISSIKEATEQKIAAEQQSTALLARFSYRTKSLYDCAAEALEANGGTPFFLEEHYRSHPEIIEFSNRLYYQRRLVLRTHSATSAEQAVFWHDVPSNLPDGRGSLLNPKEAQAVRDLALQVLGAPSFQPTWTLGIVTPYRRQRDRIEQLLRAEPAVIALGDRLKIGTVHTFQGAEADIMIFSPVVTSGAKPRAAEWISKEEGLLNVALTRARRALHIVGDKAFCDETPGPLGELAKFVTQRAGVAHVSRNDNPAVNIVRSALRELETWYQEEVPETTQSRTYYLDFVIVGLSGTRYNIEIDGRQHYFSAEAIAEDDVRDKVLQRTGYKVIRLRSTDVTGNPDRLRQLLGGLA